MTFYQARSVCIMMIISCYTACSSVLLLRKESRVNLSDFVPTHLVCQEKLRGGGEHDNGRISYECTNASSISQTNLPLKASKNNSGYLN